MKIIITGGAGFIGSALCRYFCNNTNYEIVNIDALTYAANPGTIKELSQNRRFTFIKADIRDRAKIGEIFQEVRPNGIIHLAAESHVDRSIDAPADFLDTNITGTFNLLEAARMLHASLTDDERKIFRFHQVSTDEVYGSLGSGGLFREDTAYAPNSPYSASKAAADHLVRAWFQTYGLPTIISNCSNNYGPYQFPEKLIPLMILNALAEKPLPVYGDGQNVRDWLYVDDHAKALALIFEKGRLGEKYNVGGNNEVKNLAVVAGVCRILDERRPRPCGRSYQKLVAFVADRPGHDRRYAIDASKIESELGWKPAETFETGLEKTVVWYLENEAWWQAAKDAATRRAGLNY